MGCGPAGISRGCLQSAPSGIMPLEVNPRIITIDGQKEDDPEL